MRMNPEVLPAIFDDLDKDQLLSIGVPEDWLDDVLSSNEETFLRVADHLPQEAAEILLEVAGGDVSFLQAVQQSQAAREEASDTEIVACIQMLSAVSEWCRIVMLCSCP